MENGGVTSRSCQKRGTAPSAAQTKASIVRSCTNPLQVSKFRAFCVLLVAHEPQTSSLPHCTADVLAFRPKRAVFVLAACVTSENACQREALGRRHPQTAAYGVWSYSRPLLASQKQGELSSFDCTRPAYVNRMCALCGLFGPFFLFGRVCAPCVTR